MITPERLAAIRHNVSKGVITKAMALDLLAHIDQLTLVRKLEDSLADQLAAELRDKL